MEKIPDINLALVRDALHPIKLSLREFTTKNGQKFQSPDMQKWQIACCCDSGEMWSDTNASNTFQIFSWKKKQRRESCFHYYAILRVSFHDRTFLEVQTNSFDPFIIKQRKAVWNIS